MSTTGGGWTAVTGSVRGASHERDGRPNQDAVRSVAATGPVPGLVAAVCDGHGGARYVRSDVGARLGVEAACQEGLRVLEELGPAADEPAVVAALSGRVAPAVVERWRSRVLDHVGRNPFTAEERRRIGDRSDGEPFVSYGCTLVLAVLAPEWAGLLQVGDGDVTVRLAGRSTSPVPGDDRLVGGETTSLCLPTAVADARVAALVDPLPDLVVLTSDGYANSFASPDWREAAAADLEAQLGRQGVDAVEALLPGWLAESAVAGGDDVSMALVGRDAGAPMVAATRAAGVSAGSETAVGARPSGPVEVPADPTVRAGAPHAAPVGRAEPTGTARRRGRAVAAAALAGVLVGGALGWFGSGAVDGTTTTASTTTSTTSTTSTTTSTSVVPVVSGQDLVVAVGAGPDAVLALPVGKLVPGQVVGWVDLSDSPPTDLPADLPTGWTPISGGQLQTPRKVQGRNVVVEAPYVAVRDGLVWVLARDGQLTSYRATDGVLQSTDKIGGAVTAGEPGSPTTTTGRTAAPSTSTTRPGG